MECVYHRKYRYNSNNKFNHLVAPNFQKVNKIFVLALENHRDRMYFSKYYLLKALRITYNGMINGIGFFYQSEKNNRKVNKNMIEITKSNNVMSSCLLDYPYFNEHYKFVAINLNKQQLSDADSKTIQQINFVGISVHDQGATVYFVLEESKETVLEFSNDSLEVI